MGIDYLFDLIPDLVVVFKVLSKVLSHFTCVICSIFMKTEGGNVVQECKIMTKVRKEYTDDDLQQKVFHNTEELIKQLKQNQLLNVKT